MTDEIAEKSSRAEFLTGFANAIGAIQPLLAAGEQGAKMAGAMLKFALEPFNVSRDLDAIIDEFVENAPEIAAAMGDQGNGEETAAIRSEEHTSELQSLMRISYAVFCLKKKNNNTNNRKSH